MSRYEQLQEFKEVYSKRNQVYDGSQDITQDLIDMTLVTAGFEYSLSKDSVRGWTFWYWYIDPSKCEWADAFKMKTDFKWYKTKISAAMAAFMHIMKEEKI